MESEDLSLDSGRVLGPDEIAQIESELARHAAVGLYRLDADGRLIHANIALAWMLAYPSVAELLPARADFRAGLYADAAHAERVDYHLKKHQRVERFELEVMRADQTRSWVAETAIVLRDGDGQKTGEAGTLVDIGERRGTEEALSRSEQTYRALVERMEDVVYVHRGGRIVYVNGAIVTMLGYQADEVIGWETERFFAPSEQWRINQNKTARASGDQRHFRYQTRLLARDGTTEVPVSIDSGPIPHLGEDAVMGTVRDLSGERESERRVAEAHARYQDFVEHLPVAIYQSTPSGELLDANPALVRMLGYASLDDLRANVGNVRDLYVFPGERGFSLVKLEAEGLFKGRELRLLRRDGTRIWVSETARVVRDEAGNPVCYEGMLEDISVRKKVEKELRFRASHDPLTNLPDRELLGGYLSAALKDARQKGQASHALLFADLNVVRGVNDSLGHAQGDCLLREVATRLCRAAGPRDVLCRYSGDKFALLAVNVPSRAAAEALAKRIEAALSAPFVARGHEIYPRAQLGIALCTADYDSAEGLLHDADTALAACSRVNRVNHVIFDETIRDAAAERLQLESDMRVGLERGEFEMHYQPIYDMVARRVVAFEALLRWRHPERGLLLPAHFLRTAEETGLIMELGRTGFDEAIAECLKWQGAEREIAVACNLSNSQFDRERLPDVIAAGLARAGLPPRLLHLEVTETVFLRDPERARATFARLRALGVQFHLDDYGTGYAGLPWLRELKFDALKLDRYFVARIASDARTRAIVGNVIGLARDLDMDVIAEGIEHEEEADVLAGMHCRFAQGYYYGAAMDAKAALALVGNSS